MCTISYADVYMYINKKWVLYAESYVRVFRAPVKL